MSSQTLDMRFIRYLNLFEKITRISTKNCFFYNNAIIFVVPYSLMSRAIGNEGENVKRLSSLLQKKVKIVPMPSDSRDLRKFIIEIISPITFKNIQITSEEIVISGNMQSRAALIGRNKVRLQELSKVVKEFFGKNLRIA